MTTLALEVPTACLLAAGANDPVIGGWTTRQPAPGLAPQQRAEEPATRPPRSTAAPWAQVSRLGMPLVNEVVIGLKDKDRFNASKPKDDAQFADYVTNPTLPALLELALGDAPGMAPKNLPRTDLVDDLPDRHRRASTSRRPPSRRGRDAAPQHRHRAGAARAAEPPRRAGGLLGRPAAATWPAIRTAAGRTTTWSTSRWWR